MRLPGVKLAQRSFRRARSRLLGGIAVLGYHRIGDGEDPFGLAVSVHRFAAQLEILTKTAHPMHLSDVVCALTQGTVPRRGVVVTFDDGYRDTLDEALPLIERAGIPATVFVTTGSPGREFWWDELTRIVMGSEALPHELKLDVCNRQYSWSLSAQTRTRSVGDAARRKLLAALSGELRVLRPTEREDAMRALRAWAGQSSDGGTRRPRALTSAELQQLAASPCVEIGAHTVSHPMLPKLPREEQQEEVQRSRLDLQLLTGRPVTSFSYPHGAYSDETLSTVAEAGFTIACCSTPDLATRRSDPLALPRLWVSDQDARAFARWLGSWLLD